MMKKRMTFFWLAEILSPNFQAIKNLLFFPTETKWSGEIFRSIILGILNERWYCSWRSFGYAQDEKKGMTFFCLTEILSPNFQAIKNLLFISTGAKWSGEIFRIDIYGFLMEQWYCSWRPLNCAQDEKRNEIFCLTEIVYPIFKY